MTEKLGAPLPPPQARIDLVSESAIAPPPCPNTVDSVSEPGQPDGGSESNKDSVRLFGNKTRNAVQTLRAASAPQEAGVERLIKAARCAETILIILKTETAKLGFRAINVLPELQAALHDLAERGVPLEEKK